MNAQNTFVELLNMGVIPIVNENDTLAVTVCYVAQVAKGFVTKLT